MSQHDAPMPGDPRNAPKDDDPTTDQPTNDTPQHDDTTLETFLDESDDAPSRPSDHPEPASAPASEPVSDQDSRPVDPSPTQPYAPPPASPYAAASTQPAVPEYKSGPAPTTSVIGLIGVLVAIAVLVTQVADLDIRWDIAGPVTAVGAGVLLVVLGLAGLRGQRFRS
ncbi:hypothetical protein N802_15965 [Knoellia sinensis KCTC 19936]|uniref:Uncharacterized protein n=1 Tax=Knoellia sinensis KCTC 19936 TaxID=1385520 RepID=A0A0A0J7A0_9MICO|nr:hypothetical protein [Knoellia sinensis]KGN33013.1 hypothetical protein N802_15965 [Knoellia sinensis KCTC 19936]